MPYSPEDPKHPNFAFGSATELRPETQGQEEGRVHMYSELYPLLQAFYGDSIIITIDNFSKYYDKYVAEVFGV